MGNRSSAPSHPGDSGGSLEEPQRGRLDPRNQIKDVYEKMLANDKVKARLKKTFRQVRILVVGISGCGKTTLIRVLIGANGPQNIVEGRCGEQEIMREWRHPDPALPLIIHDSNGIDTLGENRKADIKNFLESRLANMSTDKFAERVHAVWYVFSAMDARVLDDCGLLEMLDSYDERKLPLLLIMTNNDIVQQIPSELVKVDEEMLERLLGKIKDEKKRKSLRDSMVRVGNQIALHPDTGEIVKDKSEVDWKGMVLVYERTKQLIDKKLWRTWMACQVLDMGAKLEASSNLIVATQKKQVVATCVVAALPIAQQVQLGIAFGTITRGLSMIWNVSENLEKAITSKFLIEKRWHAVTQNLATNLFGALLLAGAVTATVLTGGIATPSLLLAAAPTLAQAGSTSTLLATFALLVLCCIIYIHTHDTIHGQGSFDDYCQLCDEFIISKFAIELSRFSKH